MRELTLRKGWLLKDEDIADLLKSIRGPLTALSLAECSNVSRCTMAEVHSDRHAATLRGLSLAWRGRGVGRRRGREPYLR